MSVPLDTQIVRRARELISDRNRWCRGSTCRDAKGDPTDADNTDAVTFCAIGAIERAAWEMGLDVVGQIDASNRIACRMHPDVAEEGLQVIFDINDKGCGRGHADVLALFDDYLRSARS